MNPLQRRGVQLLIDKFVQAGKPAPESARALLCTSGQGSTGARLWAAAHPQDDTACCFGSSLDGPEGCSCWTPVYDVEQAAPVPPAGAADLTVAPRMCGDCAYRPGSPERADDWEREALMDLAYSGVPFFCHDGMRRPVAWHHPDGRRVDGDPADYDPPIMAGIPYRADGRPGVLCAGWAAIAAAAPGRG